MQIDIPTLFVVIVFVLIVAGVLLLFSWWQNRTTVALGLWGIAYLFGATGGALITLRGVIPLFWSTEMGNGLALVGYALMWSGARSFEGRRVSLSGIAAGAIVWVIACQFDGFLEGARARVVLFSAMAAIYVLATALEYLHSRDRELMSRWPAIVLLLVHAIFFGLRIVLVDFLPFPAGISGPHAHWIPVGTLALLLHHFCMAFLVVNMTKERAELRHRQVSQIDPLTGVANRRAFIERGERMLQRMKAEGRSATLLLLDLDLFKQINDNFGHQTGDRVLCTFCDIASGGLRPDDLFGRLGGEEFACLLPDASLADALSVAERIRAQFEGRPVEVAMRRSVSTVSIGVTTTSDVGHSLTAMLAAADRGLYEAKAKGRNRVEHARPPLVGIPAHAAVG